MKANKQGRIQKKRREDRKDGDRRWRVGSGRIMGHYHIASV